MFSSTPPRPTSFLAESAEPGPNSTDILVFRVSRPENSVTTAEPGCCASATRAVFYSRATFRLASLCDLPLGTLVRRRSRRTGSAAAVVPNARSTARWAWRSDAREHLAGRVAPWRAVAWYERAVYLPRRLLQCTRRRASAPRGCRVAGPPHQRRRSTRASADEHAAASRFPVRPSVRERSTRATGIALRATSIRQALVPNETLA